METQDFKPPGGTATASAIKKKEKKGKKRRSISFRFNEETKKPQKKGTESNPYHKP